MKMNYQNNVTKSIKIMFSLMLFLSLTGYSENIIQDVSLNVKVEYKPDGTISIFSLHNSKKLHNFDLRLQIPETRNPSRNMTDDNSIIYEWSDNIVEEWKLHENILKRIITVKNKQKRKKLSQILSFLVTDLGALFVNGPPTFSALELENNNNLRIDESVFSITDSKCQQPHVKK